jgi:hypothetical protein
MTRIEDRALRYGGTNCHSYAMLGLEQWCLYWSLPSLVSTSTFLSLFPFRFTASSYAINHRQNPRHASVLAALLVAQKREWFSMAGVGYVCSTSAGEWLALFVFAFRCQVREMRKCCGHWSVCGGGPVDELTDEFLTEPV